MPNISALVHLLIGKAVETLEFNEDLFVKFAGGDSLEIDNQFELFSDGVAADKEILLGEKVCDVAYDGTWLVISFGADGNIEVRVDMRDTAFRGPEALIFRTLNGEILVWN